MINNLAIYNHEYAFKHGNINLHTILYYFGDSNKDPTRMTLTQADTTTTVLTRSDGELYSNNFQQDMCDLANILYKIVVGDVTKKMEPDWDIEQLITSILQNEDLSKEEKDEIDAIMGVPSNYKEPSFDIFAESKGDKLSKLSNTGYGLLLRMNCGRHQFTDMKTALTDEYFIPKKEGEDEKKMKPD